MRKRWLKIALLILGMPSFLALFLVFEAVRGRISLARYQRELIVKGEKLTPKALGSSLSSEGNAAPELWAAIEQLKEGILLPNTYPPRMRATPTGGAIVCFREGEWVEGKATNRWEHVSADLEPNERTLHQIRATLEKPVLDNQLDFTQAPQIPIRHLAPAKRLTQWLGARSQTALHEGRTHEAVEDLIAEARLPRALAADRILISELVRIAIAALARTGVWEALQADGWTDADLSRLQQAWESQSFATNMAYSLEGELVFGVKASDLMRKSNRETIEMLFAWNFPFGGSEPPVWEQRIRDLPAGEALADFLKEQVYCRIWRFAWLDQRERRYLEHMYALLGIARKAGAQKSFAAIGSEIDGLVEKCQNKNGYDELRYPKPDPLAVVVAGVKRAMRAETERSTVLCAIAVKRYSIKHGQLPTSLDSLVPEFLPSVPIDYMDGQPVKYRLVTDATFTLYSVGEDLKDDGGDNSLPAGKKSFGNPWDRRDFVWPSPATPEEIDTYRAEAAKR